MGICPLDSFRIFHCTIGHFKQFNYSMISFAALDILNERYVNTDTSGGEEIGNIHLKRMICRQLLEKWPKKFGNFLYVLPHRLLMQ